MWINKIRFKKQKYCLIALIIIVTSIIFSCCIGLIVSVNKYVKDYYADTNNADFYVNTCAVNVKDNLDKWADDKDYVESVDHVKGYFINSVIDVNDEKIDANFIYAMLTKDYKDFMWNMNCKNGDLEGVQPERGKIWISSIFAALYDVEVGDEISFLGSEKESFEVSAILNDALVPSATLGFDYLFVNEEDEDKLKEYMPNYLSTVKLKDDADYQDAYDEFIDDIGADSKGVIMTKPLLVSVATMISSILGGIGTFAAVVIFIGVIFIIRFILNNELKSEIKAIGTYKSLGFLSKEIRSIYIKAFGVVVACGSIAGVIISVPIIKKIANNVLQFIGDFTIDYSTMAIVGGFTFLIINMVVFINLLLVTKKACAVSPVTALCSSDEGVSENIGKPLIKNASSAFSVAINDIVKHKKSSTMILLVLLVSFYLLELFVNIDMSISGIRDNPNVWFGTPKCTATITGNFNGNLDDIKEYLDSSEYVDSYETGDMILTSGVSLDTQKYNLTNTNIGYEVFNEYGDDAKFSIDEGRNPSSSDEVAVNKDLLKEAGLKVGDDLELTINDEIKEFKIVGQYASLLNLGYNLRILSDVLDDSYVPGKIFVRLNDKNDFDEFKNITEDKYYGTSVDDVIPDIKNTLSSMEEIVNPVVLILLIAFTIFALINILNLIISENKENRRAYGIMKSFGFTTGYICSKYVSKISIISILSIVLSVILNFAFSRKAFSIVLGGINGLVIDNLITSKIILITFVLIIIVTILCCLPIKLISPKDLSEE